MLDRAIAHCRKEGVGLVLENMLPHLFAGNVRDLLWVLGALNSTHIGVCLDTGRAHLSEDPGKVVQLQCEFLAVDGSELSHCMSGAWTTLEQARSDGLSAEVGVQIAPPRKGC